MKTAEKLQGVCYGECLHASLCISQIFTLQPQQNETSSNKDKKMLWCLVLSWQMVLIEKHWGSTLVQAGGAKLPGDPYPQFGNQMPRLQEIQAITVSQSKECRGQRHMNEL